MIVDRLAYTPTTTMPKEPGYYVVKLRHSERPVVLWWGNNHPHWLSGSQRVQAVAWIGPLP
jgi:hypothetical protein